MPKVLDDYGPNDILDLELAYAADPVVMELLGALKHEHLSDVPISEMRAYHTRFGDRDIEEDPGDEEGSGDPELPERLSFIESEVGEIYADLGVAIGAVEDRKAPPVTLSSAHDAIRDALPRLEALTQKIKGAA